MKTFMRVPVAQRFGGDNASRGALRISLHRFKPLPGNGRGHEPGPGPRRSQTTMAKKTSKKSAKKAKKGKR
jgi:hypothetical protein